MFDDYVRAVVGRRNIVTGKLYRDDPAIFSWQLANEPRPGGSDEAGRRHMKAYLAWIEGTARLIKSIDPNHMVSTGSEGTQGCINDAQCVVDAHQLPRDRLCQRPYLATELELGRSEGSRRHLADGRAQHARLHRPAARHREAPEQAAGHRGIRLPARRRTASIRPRRRPSRIASTSSSIRRSSTASAQGVRCRAAISGAGAAKAELSIPIIISFAATPATSATRRTSRRVGTASSTSTSRRKQ